MSTTYNSSIVRDGLVLHLDAANRKSFIGAAPKPLISASTWALGSGGNVNFNQNGSTDENERVLATDPWGNQSIVWETRCNGTAADDGGWNSTHQPIDNTKLYRFSVWVRRTSASGGGTFYFGTGAGGEEVLRTDNSATAGNPYWDCRGTSDLAQNVWYLVCGHIYPVGTTYTGKHPHTGYYTIASGVTKVKEVSCNIGQDLKWAPGSNAVNHRTYHYYSPDNTTRLQFAFPRIDLCDGREPTIKEMLENGESQWKDLSGNAKNYHVANNPVHTGKEFNINTEQWFDYIGSYSTVYSGTVVIFYKTADTEELWLTGFGPLAGNGRYLSAASLNGAYYHGDCGSPINYIDLNQITNPTSYKDDKYHMWEAKGVNVSSWPRFTWFGYNPGWNMIGSVAVIMMYDRVLTAEESKQNLNAIRGRFSI